MGALTIENWYCPEIGQRLLGGQSSGMTRHGMDAVAILGMGTL